MEILASFFFFFALALATAELSTAQLLKGSVTCLDCTHGFDLSGIQVLVKCDKVKKLAMAYTEVDGEFEAELPSDEASDSAKPINCMAKIMGGPYQLYTKTKDSVAPIAYKANAPAASYFTTTNPLNFYKACPLESKCGAKDMGFGASKTVDLPIPGEWGLAPTSYYVPFIPIIGIP